MPWGTQREAAADLPVEPASLVATKALEAAARLVRRRLSRLERLATPHPALAEAVAEASLITA